MRGSGSKQIEDAERARLRKIFIGVGFVGAAVFGLGAVTRSTLPDEAEPFRDAYALAFASVVVSSWVACQLVGQREPWRRVFAATATIVLVADVWFARAPAMARNWTAVPDTARDAIVLSDKALAGECRFLDRGILKWRPGTRMQRRDFSGYDNDPLSLKRFDFLQRSFVRAPRLLGHANVCMLHAAAARGRARERRITRS